MSFWSEEIVQEAETTGNYEVLPAGDYSMMIIDSELRETKAGGHYLNVTFELSGNDKFDGKKVFKMFNVDNANPKAVSIGLGELKLLAAACKNIEWYENLKTATSWEDAEEKLNTIFEALGNIIFIGNVIIVKSDQYGDKNEVKRFKESSGIATAKPKAKADAKKSDTPWD
jgi:hypothetical protein